MRTRCDKLTDIADTEQFLWHKVTANIVYNKLNVDTKYAHIILVTRILKYAKLHRCRSVRKLFNLQAHIYE